MNSPVKLSSSATREFWEIPVLFEDEHVMALDKPAGLPTAADADRPDQPNLTQLLHAGITAAKPWARERNLSYLNVVHRLDQDTTGVLLLAKTKPVFLALADLFGAEKPERKYLALVQGQPTEDTFESDRKLASDPYRLGSMQINPEGKTAHTRFEVVEKFTHNTLLRCSLLTDRVHQIRVHLANLGLPLVGDSLYGGKQLLLSQLKRSFRLKGGKIERPLISTPALHAEQLILPHPITGEILNISAALPKDLVVGMKYLRLFANGGSTVESSSSDF